MGINVKLFRLKDFVRDDEVFHLARTTIHSRQDLSLHQHDFAEIFWVENGTGIHLINDERIILKPGHLVMIRPNDRHAFTSSKDGITIMNLAFPAETLDIFYNRYFVNSTTYFWTTAPIPFHTLIDIDLIRQLSQKTEDLWKYQKSNIYVDILLLGIFRLIMGNSAHNFTRQIPFWLNNAIQRFSSPESFKEGASGFAALCERNIDHVNRTVKAYLNQTLSDLVTELRMAFAAKQLSITSVPIKTICQDCGFNNMAHFYKTFKGAYHQTPAEFRKSNQTIV